MTSDKLYVVLGGVDYETWRQFLGIFDSLDKANEARSLFVRHFDEVHVEEVELNKADEIYQ